MNSAESGILAFVCALVAVFFGYMAVTTFRGWQDIQTAGLAVLAFAVLFGLWWLFGEARPTGLQLARKTVGKLTEEEAERGRFMGMGWVLFGAAAVLVLAVLVAGGGIGG
jgi:hypothetical protein